jgi:hypothetical protein
VLVNDHVAVELADIAPGELVHVRTVELADRLAIHSVDKATSDKADCAPALVVEVVGHWTHGMRDGGGHRGILRISRILMRYRVSNRAEWDARVVSETDSCARLARRTSEQQRWCWRRPLTLALREMGRRGLRR